MRKLLDAGMQVFARRGYHATRVDDIVKLARTSHGTFYLYFSNKEDLLRALILDCSEEMSTLIRSLGPIGPGVEGYDELRAWLARFVELYVHYGPVVRAWTEAAETVSPEFAQLGGEMLGGFAGTLSERIAEADPQGAIRADLAAIAFVAMIERVHYFVVTGQVDVDEDELLDTLATITHLGVFGSTRRRTGGLALRRQ